MVSVDAQFTVRDVQGMPTAVGKKQDCSVEGVLVYAGEDGHLLLVADWNLKLIRAFDLVTWQCVSICQLVPGPAYLYQVKGQVYVHCNQEIYRVTVDPLAASFHGHTITHYDAIASIGHDHLIATTGYELHVISTSGGLVHNITTKRGNFFDRMCSLTADDMQVVVVDKYGTLAGTNRLVCLTLSEDGSSVSINWTYDGIPSFIGDPILTSGVVIVPCSNPNTIILIDRYSGKCRQRISPTNDPEMDYGTCIYNDRLFIGAGDRGVVMEFHILRKYNKNVQPM
jgi:hypothetical protein